VRLAATVDPLFEEPLGGDPQNVLKRLVEVVCFCEVVRVLIEKVFDQRAGLVPLRTCTSSSRVPSSPFGTRGRNRRASAGSGIDRAPMLPGRHSARSGGTTGSIPLRRRSSGRASGRAWQSFRATMSGGASTGDVVAEPLVGKLMDVGDDVIPVEKRAGVDEGKIPKDGCRRVFHRAV